nr:hypothetical protein [Acetobacter conturbans]
MSQAKTRQAAPKTTPARRKPVSAKKRAEQDTTLFAVEEVEVAPVRVKADPICEALYFDSDWYRTSYPDVADAGVDAATHYRTTGFREGRKPNAIFDAKAYLAVNPDLAGYDGDLFLHYVFFGASEGRPLSV